MVLLVPPMTRGGGTMVTLLKLWKHARQEGPKSRPAVTGSPVEPDTLLLLIPDGGPSFRLLPFAAKEPAQAYIQNHDLIARQRGLVAFWALHTDSVPQRLSTDGAPPEAVVMMRAPGRPGVVYLYSFVDMETACSSLRDWLANGLEPANVLLYWAAPVALDRPAVVNISTCGTPASSASCGEL